MRSSAWKSAYKADPNVLRVVQAYASVLARPGNRDEALKAYQAFDEALPRHPLVTDVIWPISKPDGGCRQIVDTPQAGAAEALYTIGAALGRRGEDVGLVYLQLALYLMPNHALAITSLADIYEGMRKPELAIKTYERVPAASPLSHNAQIQRALNLDQLERTDEAIADSRLIVAQTRRTAMPRWRSATSCARARSSPNAADVYSKAIDSIGKAEKSDWVRVLFPRHLLRAVEAVAEGRSRLQAGPRALPDQPLVLNYLGYSWVDQGVNLDEGMRMIRAPSSSGRTTATSSTRSAGPISARRLREAVKHLEHAVELKPERPDDQRPPRRRLLAGRPRARGDVPVDACARPQAGAGRPGEDQGEARNRA